MDWLTSLLFAFSSAHRRQEKEEQKQKEEITSHWNEIADAIFDMNVLLSELSFSQRYALDECQTNDLEELAPLFPMAEILSMQGRVGPVQEQFLQSYFNIHQTRYNLGQFLKAAIEREGVYPQWDALCGLREDHCGEIWHTLIEIICRLCEPERFQQATDHLGAILYNFWFLDHSDIEPAQIRFHRILSNLNAYAASDQELPYLHAVMFLQRVLSERYGGEIADYFPRLGSNEPYPMDGTEGFLFEVWRKDGFSGSYAVRKTNKPHNCDLIWELPPEGGAPTVLFSE